MSAPGHAWTGDGDVVTSAMEGDEAAFASITEGHRRELQVHCYRMLGSLQDAEDAVQDTFLRAWRSRASFVSRGPGSFRAWLYRIATNASIDMALKKPRAPFPWGPASQSPSSGTLLPPHPDLAWLQPFPDRILDAASGEEQPEAQVVARETIELAFVVAIQLLPPAQRAALLLRDVLGWSAKETAALLDTTVAAANSLLQRARSTLKQEVPHHRPAEVSGPTGEERALLRRYMDAHERCDFAALAQLLRQDARLTMPPTPSWFQGREEITALFASWLDPRSPAYVGEVRRLPIAANRQPGSAGYLRPPGETVYRPLGLELLRVEQGMVSEITMFVTADLFSAFELPASL